MKQRLGDIPDVSHYSGVSPVAARAATLARQRGYSFTAPTIHGWMYSTTQMRPSDRVALLVDAAAALGEYRAVAAVLSPIRLALRQQPIRSLDDCLADLRESFAIADFQCRIRPAATAAIHAALTWLVESALGLQRALRQGQE